MYASSLLSARQMTTKRLQAHLRWVTLQFQLPQFKQEGLLRRLQHPALRQCQ
jgi:hypothetical protein